MGGGIGRGELIVTYMGLPLGRLPSHEGVGQAILKVTLPIAGLVVAFKLARAPSVVKGAVAAPLLAKLHVVIDHLIWICAKNRGSHKKMYLKILHFTNCYLNVNYGLKNNVCVFY